MQSQPVEEMSERTDTNWRHRVATLESLVAELLVKNQNMHFNLQTIKQRKSASETVALS
jgi:hypothetical protein